MAIVNVRVRAGVWLTKYSPAIERSLAFATIARPLTITFTMKFAGTRGCARSDRFSAGIGCTAFPQIDRPLWISREGWQIF